MSDDDEEAAALAALLADRPAAEVEKLKPRENSHWKGLLVVRVWDGGRALIAATCVATAHVGPRLTLGGELRKDRRKPGGRMLLCRACYADYNREPNRAASRRFRSTPEGRAASREASRRLRSTPEGRAARRESDNATRGKYRRRTPAEVLSDRRRLRPDGTKVCRDCAEVLPLTDFHASRSRPDGLHSSCKPCTIARNSNKLLKPLLPSLPARDLWSCTYCSRPFDHVDHIIPRRLKGPDAPENLTLSCAACNSSKNSKPLHGWFADLPPGHRSKPHPRVLAWLTESLEAATLGLPLPDLSAITADPAASAEWARLREAADTRRQLDLADLA